MSNDYRGSAIAWDELHTNDRDRAEAFYTALFGWSVTPVEMSPEYTYHLLNRPDTGQMFAGAHQQDASEAHTPPYWLVSLTTPDVDRATAKASELGATVIMEPMDIPGTGRFSLFLDPQGAPVGALTYSDDGEAPDRGEAPGCIVWHELVSGDLPASAAFYASVFDVTPTEHSFGDWSATLFMHGDEMVANILPKPSPDAPDGWLFYVAVADIDATVAQATQAGGTVVVPPRALDPIGTIAWLADPTGAVFGLLQPAERER